MIYPVTPHDTQDHAHSLPPALSTTHADNHRTTSQPSKPTHVLQRNSLSLQNSELPHPLPAMPSLRKSPCMLRARQTLDEAMARYLSLRFRLNRVGCELAYVLEPSEPNFSPFNFAGIIRCQWWVTNETDRHHARQLRAEAKAIFDKQFDVYWENLCKNGKLLSDFETKLRLNILLRWFPERASRNSEVREVMHVIYALQTTPKPVEEIEREGEKFIARAENFLFGVYCTT